MTLAIVDDDQDVRTALARLLTAMGHRVTVFASAEDFEAAPVVVDCMIVDVRLPGINGLEFRQKLRSQSASVPLVLMTGDGDRLNRDARIGDTPIVSKPFDDMTLTAAIADAILATKATAGGHAH
ncbi:MAG TPA: response regulator [Vicinamibacterales bacterium]|nr:response regulator [Vicinamibacterales bacterium]